MPTRAVLFARTKELVLVLAVLILVIGLAGCAKPSANPISYTGTGGTCTLAANATLPANAQRQVADGVVAAANQLGLGKDAIIIGWAVTLTESGMKVINFGDYSSNGQMTTSRGPFQQKEAWGDLADRLDPTKAALMFFKGGAAGQQGLTDITGWETMPKAQAAQAVQKSQFSDGSNFAAQISTAEALASSLTCVAAPAGGGPGGTVNVALNGPSLTLPDDPNVAAAVRGKTIRTPSDGMAKGIAAGLRYLGAPYVWGGGGDGAGPNNGCSRGGGDYNSCGSEIGFDCSGLTAYVYVQGGYPSPGGNSGAQRSGGMAVPYSQAAPGDIVGFPGHVAISLGIIDGTHYILEASWVGTPIHVVPLTRSDRDASLHRYWGTANV